MLQLASCRFQSQHDPKISLSSQRFLRQSSHTVTTLRPGSLSYTAPWLFTQDTIIPVVLCAIAYRYHRQTAFDVSKKDSGFLEWGKATKDPLRKCSWEKKQRWGTCNLKSISPKPCWTGLRLPCSSSQLQNFWPEIKILTFIFKFFHNVFHHLMVEGFPSLYDCDVQTVVDFLEFLGETEQNTYIKGTQWKPMANVY